jgi:hypothetical protein
MHLVQFLVPLHDGVSRRRSTAFAAVRRELTGRFGGVTAYERSPATGLWQRDDGEVERDRMVMIEVEARDLDRAWWRQYRRTLEQLFAQETILIRAIPIDPL